MSTPLIPPAHLNELLKRVLPKVGHADERRVARATHSPLLTLGPVDNTHFTREEAEAVNLFAADRLVRVPFNFFRFSIAAKDGSGFVGFVERWESKIGVVFFARSTDGELLNTISAGTYSYKRVTDDAALQERINADRYQAAQKLGVGPVTPPPTKLDDTIEFDARLFRRDTLEDVTEQYMKADQTMTKVDALVSAAKATNAKLNDDRIDEKIDTVTARVKSGELTREQGRALLETEEKAIGVAQAHIAEARKLLVDTTDIMLHAAAATETASAVAGVDADPKASSAFWWLDPQTAVPSSSTGKPKFDPFVMFRTHYAMLVNHYAMLVNLCYAYLAPYNFTAVVSPNKPGKSVEWVKGREHYTIVHRHHAANSADVAEGAELDSSDATTLKRVAHSRRAHTRLLRSDRYKEKKGQRIAIRATWVGPKEWQEEGGRQIYRIIV